MSYESIISVLGIIIFILFTLFSIFLLSVKAEKKLSNRLLAAFLLATALDISSFFYQSLISLPPVLEMLRIQLSNFKEPLLFLYILSVIYTNFQLKKIHFVHLLPWIVSLLVLTPNFFLASEEAKHIFLNNYINQFEIAILRYFSHALSLVYLIAEVYYIVRYRKLLLENYADKDAFKNYKWLEQLTVLLFIGHIMTVVKNSVGIDPASNTIYYILTVMVLSFGVFFICWLFLKAVNSPKLFKGIDVNLMTSHEMKMSLVSNTEETQQITLLKEYMSLEKPYLNPSLSIKNLAYGLGLNSREVSVLINQNLHQHFFDFVNEYRIEDAKKILQDPDRKKFTVLEILYEVGFNSKSSFNTAFKKHTGLTPTQFRKTNN